MFKNRFFVVLSLIVAVVLLFGGGFVWGLKFGEKLPRTVLVRGVSNIDSGDQTSVDFSIFWQAWQLIDDYYLKNKDIADQQKVYGAVSGLLGSLGDPYSTFFNPEDGEKFEQDIQGNFSGIGAEIGIKNNQLVIVAPLKDTPASRSGLLPSDQIIKIDSTPTQGLTVDKAVTLIRGPENTEVVLTILRKDWIKPKEFKITRARITAPTLDFGMKDNEIAYVQLYSFNANAGPLFFKAMLKALAGGARGMVLDLRNNPGGYLEVAADLAGWFLPRGTLVVSEENRSGIVQRFVASGNEALVGIPVVILMNEGSASASEILAGALRDNRGAKIVGEQSFGKGTVQELQNLKDGSSLKITVAHWVLPNGKVLEGDGLKPDVEVKIAEDDIQNNRDPQLEKALQIVREEILK